LRSLWLYIILSAILSATVPAIAASGVVLEPADTSVARLEAPQFLTRAVAVLNAAAERREFRESLQLPSGWRSVAADSLFSVAADGRDLRLLCVAIPADAVPGIYSLTYRVYDRSGEQLAAETALRIEVLPVLKIDLALKESPRRVLAGEEYAVQFDLWSRANIPSNIIVYARASTGVPVRVGTATFSLEPGEKRVVTAIVSSRRDIRQAEPQWLIFRVEAAAGNERTAAQSTTSADIVPRSNGGEDLYHKVPSHAAARYMGADDQSGFQLEFGGAGTLDSRGKYRLDYLVRGPRDLERHLYGLRDEYYVGVESDAAQLRVGDQLFSLSSLTERNRLGRGVKAAGHYGPLTVGAYSFASRLKYPDLSETAAFVSVAPRAPVEFKLSALDKEVVGVHRRMLALSGNTRWLPRTTVETEFGAGEGEENRAREAFAVSAKVGVDLPLRMRLSAEGIHADPDYPGYYRDQNYNTLTLYVPVDKQLRWQTSYHYFAQNLDQDTSHSTALRERQFLTGLSLSLPFRTQVNLDLEAVHRRDALPPGEYDNDEKTAGLRVRQLYHWITAGATVRRGIWRTAAADDYKPLERYGANLTVSPDSRQSYTASYQTGHTGASSSQNRIFGLSAVCRLIPGLLLSASWQKCGYSGYASYKNDQVACDVRYTIFRRHVISLRYRHLEYEQDYLSRGTSWMIGYELPVSVPVSRQSQFGCVKGRIRDAENADRSGISGAVIMLDNHTVITDSKGKFVFPSVAPGVHYLQVEKASIGLDRVTMRRVPMEVRVRGGRTEMVELAVTHGATLTGQVAVFGLGSESARGIFVEQDSAIFVHPDDSLNYLYNLPGIEVELRSDGDVRRTMTDRNGRFVFDELVPGRWTLNVSSAGLPTFHTLETDNRDLIIEPAAFSDLTIRVLPLKRSVIIVDEGKVPVITKRK
jgi:hypothetical protein